MAFVNEKIPQKVLDSFDFSVFRDQLGQPWKFKSWSRPTWTVDRERNAFMIHTGGGGGRDGEPSYETYGLWFEGNVLQFGGDLEVIRDDKGQFVSWKNPKIISRQTNDGQLQTMIALLREALIAVGWYGNTDKIHSVCVEI